MCLIAVVHWRYHTRTSWSSLTSVPPPDPFVSPRFRPSPRPTNHTPFPRVSPVVDNVPHVGHVLALRQVGPGGSGRDLEGVSEGVKVNVMVAVGVADIVGVPDALGVAVDVAVNVKVRVGVPDDVGVLVSLVVAVGVREGVGLGVGVHVGMYVMVLEYVCESVGTTVAVGVAVAVGTTVCVGVRERVRVGLREGVLVGSGVAVTRCNVI